MYNNRQQMETQITIDRTHHVDAVSTFFSFIPVSYFSKISVNYYEKVVLSWPYLPYKGGIDDIYLNIPACTVYSV